MNEQNERLLTIRGMFRIKDAGEDGRKPIPLDQVEPAASLVRRFSTGGSYINFQTADEGEDRIRAAYGDSYERLVEVKTKWDPENVFRMNKNIPPANGVV